MANPARIFFETIEYSGRVVSAASSANESATRPPTLPSEEAWLDYAAIPLESAPALAPNAGPGPGAPVELVRVGLEPAGASRLVPVAPAAQPPDTPGYPDFAAVGPLGLTVARAVPAGFAPDGSYRPTLSGRDASGAPADIPFDGATWVIDNARRSVLFPGGIVPGLGPPFVLTYYRYTGGTVSAGGGGGGGGTFLTAANIGGGARVLNPEAGPPSQLTFNTLMAAGGGVSVTEDEGVVVFRNTLAGANLGGVGGRVYRGRVDGQLQFRRLVGAGGGISVAEDEEGEETIVVQNTLTGANLGSEGAAAVYRGRNGNALEFRRLVGIGGGVAVVEDNESDTVNISNTLTGANIGEVGGGVFSGRNGDALEFRRLVGIGGGVAVAEDGEAGTVTVRNTLEGANLGSGGLGLYRGRNGDALEFYRLAAGPGIAVTQGEEELEVRVANTGVLSVFSSGEEGSLIEPTEIPGAVAVRGLAAGAGVGLDFTQAGRVTISAQAAVQYSTYAQNGDGSQPVLAFVGGAPNTSGSMSFFISTNTAAPPADPSGELAAATLFLDGSGGTGSFGAFRVGRNPEPVTVEGNPEGYAWEVRGEDSASFGVNNAARAPGSFIAAGAGNFVGEQAVGAFVGGAQRCSIGRARDGAGYGSSAVVASEDCRMSGTDSRSGRAAFAACSSVYATDMAQLRNSFVVACRMTGREEGEPSPVRIDGALECTLLGGIAYAGKNTKLPSPVRATKTLRGCLVYGNGARFGTEEDRTPGILANSWVGGGTAADVPFESNSLLPNDDTVLNSQLVFGQRITVTSSKNSQETNIALGDRVRIEDMSNCFVWGDGAEAVSPPASGSFTVACSTGGARFYTDPGARTGVSLEGGSESWGSVCDRGLKDLEAEVDPAWALSGVESLPLYRWTYKAAKDKSHKRVGPTAQDWQARFPLGQTELTISTLEFDGIALAAVKGLAQRTREQAATAEGRATAVEAENCALRGEVATLRGEVVTLRGEVATLRGALEALTARLTARLTALEARPLN